MRRPRSWQLSVLPLLLFGAGMAVQAQAPDSGPTPPNLPADHFNDCEWNQVGVHPRIDATELQLLMACENQLQAQKRAVLAVCLIPGTVAGAPRVIQACTESLDRDLLRGAARALVLASRARAYIAYGRLQSARTDYDAAITLTPRNPDLYYDRGQVSLRQRNYQDAVNDEAQAIQFSPRLARAYYLRSVAFGDLGNQPGAFNDLRTAVSLDPSLARYVTIRHEGVLLVLPPL